MFECFYCPECGDELEDVEKITEDKARGYCPNCDETFEVDSEDE